jgi:hypothetical protein
MTMKPDHATIAKFLTAVRKRGPWKLVAIHPNRIPFPKDGEKIHKDVQRVPVATFWPKSIQAMRHWVDMWNATHGVYFEINPSRLHAGGRRSREKIHPLEFKLDLAAFQYATIDLDPPPGVTPDEWDKTVRPKLAKLKQPPTLVWRSGGGMQAAWRIKPAVDLNTEADVAECKRVCVGVAAMVQKQVKLESDPVQSLDHLFRLAGSVNWPNATKKAKGRKPVLAGGVTVSPEAFYRMDDLPMGPPKRLRPVHGLLEPPGGWDNDEGLSYARLHLKHTKDLAREGVAGTAIRTARRLRDFGVSAETAFDLMAELWVPRCEYGWDDDELRTKIERAYADAENDPGCATPAYRIKQAKREFES